MEPHMDRQDDATTTEPAPPSDWPALAKAFRAREVQDLGPLVRRVTARNAGMMTGPGTNSYLIGRHDVVVIDPGPADADHVQRIEAAARGPIRQILLTHRHPDHAPGAAFIDVEGGKHHHKLHRKHHRFARK